MLVALTKNGGLNRRVPLDEVYARKFTISRKISCLITLITLLNALTLLVLYRVAYYGYNEICCITKYFEVPRAVSL